MLYVPVPSIPHAQRSTPAQRYNLHRSLGNLDAVLISGEVTAAFLNKRNHLDDAMASSKPVVTEYDNDELSDDEESSIYSSESSSSDLCAYLGPFPPSFIERIARNDAPSTHATSSPSSSVTLVEDISTYEGEVMKKKDMMLTTPPQELKREGQKLSRRELNKAEADKEWENVMGPHQGRKLFTLEEVIFAASVQAGVPVPPLNPESVPTLTAKRRGWARSFQRRL